MPRESRPDAIKVLIRRRAQVLVTMSTVDETTPTDHGSAGAARALATEQVEPAVETEQLLAALTDSSPEVRREAVEALGAIGDPLAVGPLRELLKSETSDLVPETAIQHALFLIAMLEGRTRRRTANERLQLEQEEAALRRAVVDLARRRGELQVALETTAAASRAFAVEQERVRVESLERLRIEAEVKSLADQERTQLEQSQARAAALREQLEQTAREDKAEEGRQLAELEVLRKKIEARKLQHQDKARQLRAQLDALPPAPSRALEPHQEVDQASTLRAAARRQTRNAVEPQSPAPASEGRQFAVWEALRKKVEEDIHHSSEPQLVSDAHEFESRENLQLSVPADADPFRNLSRVDPRVFEYSRGATKVCSKCGTPIHGRQLMCHYCGHALPASHLAFVGIVLAIIVLFVLAAKVGPMLFE
jgi:HEAT repeats